MFLKPIILLNNFSKLPLHAKLKKYSEQKEVQWNEWNWMKSGVINEMSSKQNKQHQSSNGHCHKSTILGEIMLQM